MWICYRQIWGHFFLQGRPPLGTAPLFSVLWEWSMVLSPLLISQVPSFVRMAIWSSLRHCQRETRQLQVHTESYCAPSFPSDSWMRLGWREIGFKGTLEVSSTSGRTSEAAWPQKSKGSLKRKKVSKTVLAGWALGCPARPSGQPLTGGVLPDAGWRSWCNLADPLQFPLTLRADLQADLGQFVFFQGEMSPERKLLSQEGNSLRTVHCINRTWPQVIYCWSLTKRLKI